MNLWFRLIAYLLSSRSRPLLSMPGGVSVLHFRVWPHDLDTSLHMNNGRYLSVMDFGRLDVMVASGLWRSVLRHKWTPIASAVAIRFRREMRLFQRFRLETRVLAWEGTMVVMEQQFFLDGGARHGHLAARALFKGGLYDRAQRRFIRVARLFEEIGASAESPPHSEEVRAFLAADEALRQAPEAA